MAESRHLEFLTKLNNSAAGRGSFMKTYMTKLDTGSKFKMAAAVEQLQLVIR